MWTTDTGSRQLLSDTTFWSGSLEDLLDAVEPLAVEGDRCVPVSSLATDSRDAGPESLFFAVPGVRQDGARFLAEAVRRGASAVVVEEGVEVPAGVTTVRVSDCRAAKAMIAARFFGYPSRHLPVVGITGTNGKTTTAHMLRSISEYDGGPTVLLGTIQYQIGDRIVPSRNTTPDPIQIQEYLRDGVLMGARLAIMEVSSHALEQERVTGMEFQAGVFTNLTPEHLDYHGTFEAYREVKARLFDSLESGATAVLNADDDASDEFARRTRARVIRYGLRRPADVTATVRRLDIDGTSFILETPLGKVDINTRLMGRHNLMNAMAAATSALALELPLEAVRGGLQQLNQIPGRLESIDCGQDFRVLVDYAHTHDALAMVLENLRPLTRGRLITVFGCGGDRDRSKRPAMGEVAARMSDIVIVTSDNPRSEDPLAIIEEIRGGVPQGHEVDVEPDRRAAIDKALRIARGGDIVIIAGKGHENEQLIADDRIAFDDGMVAREVLWSL